MYLIPVCSMATIIRIGLQLVNIFINDYFLYYLINFLYDLQEN